MCKLCYVFPDGQVVELDAKTDDTFWLRWMHGTVESSPDVIFFYTIATTDIW